MIMTSQLVVYAILLDATAFWFANGQLQPNEPIAKKIVRSMDEDIAHQYEWNNFTAWNQTMSLYFEQDFIYDTVYGLGNFSSIYEFYNGEHIPWNMAYPNATFASDIGFIFAASNKNNTVTCTGYAQAFMKGDFVTIPATNKFIQIIDLDFYIVNPITNKISYNWCIMDTYGMMVQSGYRLLPYNGLPEGIFYPPMCNYGIPAPISKFVYINDSYYSEIIIKNALYHDFVLKSNKLLYWNDNLQFYGGYGLGFASNKQIYYNYIVKPIINALNNTYIKYNLIVCEGKFCGAHGYLNGIQIDTLFGQNATNKQIHLRFGWHFYVENSLIVQSWCLFDIPDIVNQMGTDLWKVINDTTTLYKQKEHEKEDRK